MGRADAVRTTALADVLRLAARQEGVLGRRQVYAAGVTRWQVQALVRRGAWRRVGRQTLVTHSGPLAPPATWWAAVLEVGPRAALDGEAALVAAGVRGLRPLRPDVIVPKSSQPLRPRGVRVRESRRYRPEDVVDAGLPRVRPAVAAVHAALWAGSDREAALLLVVPVQQRVVRVDEVAEALAGVRRHRRLRLLQRLLSDIADGAQSLGELDVARALRRRRLPPAARQVLLRRPDGSAYLDVDFPGWGLALEIDGSQHAEPDGRVDDALRDLDATASGRAVVRISLLTWRLREAAVLDGLDRVFRARGWRAPGDLAA